jgi:preprotein translocase subunit SecD
MRANTWRFNLFLALMALAVLCGCQTVTRNKEVSVLRVHIESNSSDTGASQTVSLLRSDPVLVTIDKEQILTEANMVQAGVIDTRGGFALQIHFDEISARVLEQYSAANPGRHFAIFGQWGEKPAAGRWLAAPLITHRIADGILSFTPDMSREEAGRLALGLNNVAKKMRKGQLK